MSNEIFTRIHDTVNNILSKTGNNFDIYPFKEGQEFFATDINKIFIDQAGQRRIQTNFESIEVFENGIDEFFQMGTESYKGEIVISNSPNGFKMYYVDLEGELHSLSYNATELVEITSSFGRTGLDGFNSFVINLYQLTDVDNSLISGLPKPTGVSGNYNFATNTLNLTSVPSGWVSEVSDLEGDWVYDNGEWRLEGNLTGLDAEKVKIIVSEVFIFSRDEFYEFENLEGSSPRKFREDAASGANIFLFKATSTFNEPNPPTTELLYNLENFNFEPGVGDLDGWTTTPPEVSTANRYVWVIGTSVGSNIDFVLITSGEWSQPKLYSRYSLDGFNEARILLYRRFATQPSAPNIQGTYDFDSSSWSIGPTIGQGFSLEVPATDGNPLWVSAVSFASREVEVQVNKTASTPVKMVTDGLNIATVYIYKRTSSSTAPTDKPTGNSTYNFSNGVLTLPGANNGWSSTIPSSGGRFLWVRIATAISTTLTDTILDSEWSDAKKLSEDGTQGTQGLIGPTAVFKGTYSSSEAYTREDNQRDVVFYSGQYYILKTTAAPGNIVRDNPATGDDWKSFEFFQYIASELAITEESIVRNTVTIGEGQDIIISAVDGQPSYLSIGQNSNNLGYGEDGIFLGMHGTNAPYVPRLSLKGAEGYLEWNGSALSIKGDLNLVNIVPSFSITSPFSITITNVELEYSGITPPSSEDFIITYSPINGGEVTISGNSTSQTVSVQQSTFMLEGNYLYRIETPQNITLNANNRILKFNIQTGFLLSGEWGTSTISVKNSTDLFEIATNLSRQASGGALGVLSVNGQVGDVELELGQDPGGSDGQIQFNEGGSFGGSLNLTWDSTNNRLGIGANNPAKSLEIVESSNATLQIRTNSTANNSTSILRFANSTSNVANNGAAEILSIRTNENSSGDSDLIFRTAVGSTLSDRIKINDSGLTIETIGGSITKTLGNLLLSSPDGRIILTPKSEESVLINGDLLLGTELSKAKITYPTNTARTFTIPNTGANAEFVMTEGDQTIAGSKTFSNALSVNSALSIQALVANTPATQIPVFTLDPSSSARTIATRTPAEILSDIGAAPAFTNQDSNLIFAGPSTGNPALPSFRSMVAADIPSSIVTNAKLADMNAGTIKGRITSVGAPQDLTAAQVRTLLNVADGATANTGTVTSIASGDGLTGGPITTTGTLSVDRTNLKATQTDLGLIKIWEANGTLYISNE